MSAIFGMVKRDGSPVVEAELERMNSALAPYGPDANRLWTNGNVGLGQRLTIFTPEDCLDRRPAVHAGEGPVLVSDARIDNRPELMDELGIPAAEARSLSDSAFILRAYERWGEDCARHLVGAFVFALCDVRKRTVLIARSPMGERSLFYYETPRLFAFASAPRALFALPFVPREVNRRSVADHLVFLAHEPGDSFFSGINRLQAGHTILLHGETLKSWLHRGLDIERETRFPRDSDYVEAFNALFDRVVADHLRSLTPVGVSLSGGLDSTSVAASAALKLAREGKRLQTFTEVPGAGFKGAVAGNRYADETPYVQAMARMHDNLDIHLVQSDGRFYVDELDAFLGSAEAPLLGAAQWTWMRAIQREAYERNVRVLLTGTPGNFTVSWDGRGLPAQLLREGKWRRAAAEARALAARGGKSSTLGVLASQGLMPLLPGRLWRMLKQLRAGGARGPAAAPFWRSWSPIRPEFALAQRLDERVRDRVYERRLGAPRRARALDLIQRADLRADGHRGGEALFGVQKRDPTADVRVVEYCLSIPEDQYLRNGQSRWLIRRAGADRLPAAVLDNRARGLQSAGWIEPMKAARVQIAEELARLENSPLASEIVDLGRLRRLAERIPDARGDDPRAFADYRGTFNLGITVGHFLARMETGA